MKKNKSLVLEKISELRPHHLMWIVSIVIIMGGFALSWWTGARTEMELEADLLAKARIIAGAINPARIDNLKGSEEDIFQPDYIRLKEQLWLIRHVMPQYGVLYLLGRTGNDVFFYVDSEVPGSEMYSPPGKIYKEAKENHLKAFSTGKEMLTGPYKDKWGSWVTAIVPIHNRETMKLVSLLCMDIDSRAWSENVLSHMMEPILFTLFITLTLFLYSLFHRHYENTQRRLAVSEEYMQLAIEGAGLATWEWDLRSGSITANERFSQLTGYELEELRVKLSRWHHLVHPDEKSSLQEIFEENLYGKALAFEEEHRLKHKSGSWVWVLNKGRVMERTKDGLPLRVAGTIMDISERKKSEKALKESEARFRRIFEESPIGIELYNYEGVVLEVNRACLEILGVEDAAEIKGLSAYDDPNLLSAMIDSIKLGTTKGVEITYDFDLIRSKGHYKTNRSMQAFLYIFVSSMNPTERPEDSEFLVHIQDVTEKRKAEEERRVLEKRFQGAQKMESLGLLAGGVAHDFNNILGALQGFAEMALEMVEERIPDSSAREYLKQVLKASSRASSLVEQILTFSRKTDSVRKPLDISVIAKETIKLLKPSIPSNIRIDSQISQNCGRVLADPVQIHQVLMNLCTNARQAIGENPGVIRIEISRSGFGEKTLSEENAEYVRIVVSDNGCGISAENIERIFDPFFTTKKPGEGTGLGLSVIHGIVVSCDGHIMVESNPGKGSTFYVYLPEAGDRDEASAIVGDEIIRKDGRVPMVMVVDDERALLGMINERLAARGLDVAAFSDPKAAMDFFAEGPERFDLVMIDSLTNGSGVLELAKKMRNISPHVPVIIMEGRDFQHGKAGHIEELELPQPFKLISKPLNFTDLFENIKTLLTYGAAS